MAHAGQGGCSLGSRNCAPGRSTGSDSGAWAGPQRSTPPECRQCSGRSPRAACSCTWPQPACCMASNHTLLTSVLYDTEKIWGRPCQMHPACMHCSIHVSMCNACSQRQLECVTVSCYGHSRVSWVCGELRTCPRRRAPEALQRKCLGAPGRRIGLQPVMTNS